MCDRLRKITNHTKKPSWFSSTGLIWRQPRFARSPPRRTADIERCLSVLSVLGAFRVRAFRRVVVSSSRRDSAKRKRDPIAA